MLKILNCFTSKSSHCLKYKIRKGIPIDIHKNFRKKENRINQEPTCVKLDVLGIIGVGLIRQLKRT